MPRKDNKRNNVKSLSCINTLFRRTAQGRLPKPMSCEKDIYATPTLQQGCLWGSCLLVLLLAFLAVNPVSSSSVFAEEASGELDESYGNGLVDELADYDDEAMLTAETPSTVTISFLPNAATGTMTPVDTTNGDKAKVDVKATVRVQNSGGYSVYVGSSSSDLKNGSNTIPSVTSATTYANLPINRWGYSFQEGSTVKDSYVAMPATLRSTALYANTNTNITDETKTFTLSFAARIGADKPSGTYSNSVTMSVVSSPLTVAEEVDYAFGGITDMQQMTTAICNAAPTGGVKQLRDTRDGKYYWIGKMKDGKCWMTQNLDLDLNASTTPLTSEKSDVTDDWVPTAGSTALYTTNVANIFTLIDVSTGRASWSLGDYSIMNPTNSTSCGSGLESADACSGSGTADRFKYYVTPTSANGDTNAHYILGNHYQWNTATAGTGGTIVNNDAGSIQAASSICPKGWKLPESGVDADGNAIATAGTFQGLLNAYDIVSSARAAQVYTAPLYFVRGGSVRQTNHFFFSEAGYGGNYWSSTPDSSTSDAYYIHLFGGTGFSSSGQFKRQAGYSVRCIAK